MSNIRTHLLRATSLKKYKKKSIILNDKNFSTFNLVVIGTDQDKFNYKEIKKSKFIIDCRGRYKLDKK